MVFLKKRERIEGSAIEIKRIRKERKRKKIESP